MKEINKGTTGITQVGLFVLSLTVMLMLSIVEQTAAQKIFKLEEAEDIFFPISQDFKTQIENALPQELPANPGKKRKLLVFNLHVTKNRKPLAGHYSIPYANYAILRMGEKSGAYETHFSNDTLVFTPEILNDYDALCFNNTAGVLFDDPELRMNLLDFVYGGGGFIGIHAAAATFVQWPVYDQFPGFGIMLGGYENGGHPWKENEWITIDVEEPGHPVNRASNFEKFEIADEVFQFSAPYSRDLVRVLMTIDVTKTDTSETRRILPERRADWDLAMSWIKKYGRGRVYYSSFGDNPQINWDTRILNHYLSGIQYALGDLEAPATPNNKLTPAVRVLENADWEFGISTYTFKDQTLAESIEEAAALGMMSIEAYFDQEAGAGIRKKFDANLSEGELNTLRELLIGKGIHLANYYIHKFPADETACRKIFDFGRKMGIVTFVSEPEAGNLDLIEKLCEEYDIRLAIHNHGKDISPAYWNPEVLIEKIRDRSPLIGACGDIGYWIRSGIDPLEAINILGDRLFVLHVHDLDKDSRKGHDVPWGEGIADLDKLFQTLYANNPGSLFISLEYAHNFGKSIPEIQKSIGYFNKIITALGEK
jgi:sugar phosphate isomerase/epimerase/type 1 glutamine amidotransferase